MYATRWHFVASCAHACDLLLINNLEILARATAFSPKHNWVIRVVVYNDSVGVDSDQFDYSILNFALVYMNIIGYCLTRLRCQSGIACFNRLLNPSTVLCLE